MTQTISDSEFYKWRCLVALAHADGVVTEEERAMMNGQFANVAFTAAQLEVLEDDLKDPHDPAVMFSRIKDERHRTDLIHLAHLLFWSDGEFHETERRLFELLKKHAKEGYEPGAAPDVTRSKSKDEAGKEKGGIAGFFRKIFGY